MTQVNYNTHEWNAHNTQKLDTNTTQPHINCLFVQIYIRWLRKEELSTSIDYNSNKRLLYSVIYEIRFECTNTYGTPIDAASKVSSEFNFVHVHVHVEEKSSYLRLKLAVCCLPHFFESVWPIHKRRTHRYIPFKISFS